MDGTPRADDARKRRPSHPIFARFFHRLSRTMEHELGPQRERLLDGLRGRVLEVGAGNGMNFSHYPTSVAEVVALEPEPYLRAKALEAAARARVPVRVLNGLAAPLPFAAATFDAAVASLVLCTVPDPAGALTELGRVVKQDGEQAVGVIARVIRPRRSRRLDSGSRNSRRSSSARLGISPTRMCAVWRG